MEPVLSLRGIGKSFLGSAALTNVDFDLFRGEVHALLGENGAGKSTLIKTMTGVYQPDEGSVLLEGKPIQPSSPAHAMSLGISTVYQEVNLVPNLTVMENLLLGREPRGILGIDWKQMRSRAERLIHRLGLSIDVRLPLGSLPVALQQMVAIARAVDVDAKVLVLDEPTSSLDADEVGALFDVVKTLRAQGLGIVFVTHFLDQVYAISDRITVLRNGQKVGTWATAELPKLQLVTHMIGRDASGLDQPVPREIADHSAQPVIEAKELGRKGWVTDVNLTLSQGSTVGLAGLLGSGRTETTKLLFGLVGWDRGELWFRGKKMSRLSTRAAIREGIGYVSEDRKREGIFPELTVRENIVLLAQVKKGWIKKIPLSRQRAVCDELMGQLRVQPSDPERQIQFLSGGNQQKALIARWLAVQPQVLLLDEPTRGIDVGAKFEVMGLVEKLRASGSALLFVSSELAEVVRASTKVVVLRDKKCVGSLESHDLTEERVLKEIAGA